MSRPSIQWLPDVQRHRRRTAALWPERSGIADDFFCAFHHRLHKGYRRAREYIVVGRTSIRTLAFFSTAHSANQIEISFHSLTGRHGHLQFNGNFVYTAALCAISDKMTADQ